MRVVVAERPPFAFKRADLGDTIWYGYLIELLPVLLQYAGLNATVDLYEAPDNAGGVLVNGSWTGVVGELVRGNAELAAFPLSITLGRPDVVDLTYSYHDSGIGLLVRKEAANTRSFFFLRPFEWSLWLALLATVFLIALFLGVLRCVSPFGSYEIKRVRAAKGNLPATKYVIDTEGESYLMDSVMSVILNPPAPRGRSWAIRLLSLSFAFFCLITMSSYTANLASYLTVQKFETPISNLKDLVTSGLPYGLNANGASQSYFSQTLDPLAQALAPRQIIQGTIQDAVKAVRKQSIGAYITDVPTIQFYAQQLPCDLQVVGDAFGPGNFALGLPLNSALTPLLNRAMLALRGRGVLDELQRKWMRDLSQCTDVTQVSNQALTVGEFATLWWVLFGIMGVALVVALAERLVVFLADKFPGVRAYMKRMKDYRLRWKGHKRYALNKNFSILRRGGSSSERRKAVPPTILEGSGREVEGDAKDAHLEGGIANGEGIVRHDTALSQSESLSKHEGPLEKAEGRLQAVALFEASR